MNTVDPWPDADTAWSRVLGIQTKLRQWAIDDPTRRFDDLYNLVYDPAVLAEAWRRVKGNKGARSAGVDGQTASYSSIVRGEDEFLADTRADLNRSSAVEGRFWAHVSAKMLVDGLRGARGAWSA